MIQSRVQNPPQIDLEICREGGRNPRGKVHEGEEKQGIKRVDQLELDVVWDQLRRYEVLGTVHFLPDTSGSPDCPCPALLRVGDACQRWRGTESVSERHWQA